MFPFLWAAGQVISVADVQLGDVGTGLLGHKG
jgi:hypothetical protein